MIYFIRAPSVQMVKVGYTVNPIKRFSSMQGNSPVALEWVASDQRGDLLTEAEFMFRYEDHRSRGEWFHDIGPVAACVEEARLTGSVPGGWYLPLDPSFRRPGALDICAEFGFSRAEIADAFGPYNLNARPSSIPMWWIPRLVSMIAAKGQQVTYLDVLAARDASKVRAAA
jgi:hypothetical protein